MDRCKQIGNDMKGEYRGKTTPVRFHDVKTLIYYGMYIVEIMVG